MEEEAQREIRGDLEFLAKVGVLDGNVIEAAMTRVSFAGREQAPALLSQMTLLFEGVPETLAAKGECFAFLSQYISPDCIVASTTSTIAPDLMAPLIEQPQRLLCAHWLNPAHLMPLVEISPGTRTDDQVVERTREILRMIGKFPVVCRGPGYIVPRLQTLAMNEAARMVEEGVASAEDIDTAVRIGFGLRYAVLGLLEFIDWGGGDILHYASGFLSERIDADRFAAPAIIGANMADGRRGLRDGAGFYNYDGVDVAAYRAERLTEFIGMLQQRNLMPKFVNEQTCDVSQRED